jgi:hypothetical protein
LDGLFRRKLVAIVTTSKELIRQDQAAKHAQESFRQEQVREEEQRERERQAAVEQQARDRRAQSAQRVEREKERLARLAAETRARAEQEKAEAEQLREVREELARAEAEAKARRAEREKEAERIKQLQAEAAQAEEAERRRQQQESEAQVRAAQQKAKENERRSYEERGYRSITAEEFALDGKYMASNSARVYVTGFYKHNGNIHHLFASRNDVARQHYNGTDVPTAVPLLIEDASREARKLFLQCDEALGCAVTVTGRVTMCERTFLKTKLPCLSVEDIFAKRS